MFGLLGMASVFTYEPVTTVMALIAANEPPHELIERAMPLTVVFTIVLVGVISVSYARRLVHVFAVLFTCVFLVALLGLNVSVIGLVEIPSSSTYLLVELFGLIAVLDIVFGSAFLAFERRRFWARRRTHPEARAVSALDG